MPPAVGVLYMKHMTILGIFALVMLLVLPGAVSAGNTATIEGSIAQPAPVADFTVTATNGLAPIIVSFTDASTVTIGTIDTWKWEYKNYDESTWTEFGSGAQNPIDIEFSAAGAYDIRLTVSNTGGSDTKTMTHAFAAANEREPLTLTQRGMVSGGLYTESPSTYATGVTEVTHEFTLPTYTDVQWAKLYVNIYSGSAAGAFGLTSTVEFDANGDGDYLDAGEVLGIETMDIKSETNGHSFPLNDHVTKVYSDYEVQYDVTSLITSTNPVAHIKNEAIAGLSLDGRIKALTLVVAYNDGDSDEVHYWVNHGADWSSPGSGSTTFDASGLSAGWVNAESQIRYISSSDASYLFNDVTESSSSSTSYAGDFNVWDVTDEFTTGTNTLAYSKTSGSYKTVLATLTATYIAPTADFHADKTNVVIGETVTFTDDSTGSVNSWAWDFDNDGTVDSNDQNPTWTYTTAGQKTVKLTITGPLGSDDETKTDYVTVGDAIIEVTVNPDTISFGTMAAGDTKTDSTAVDVDVTYGTDWYITASASNGGYMGTGSANLATPFQLSNDGTNFQEMTSNFANFMTGAAGVDGSDTADVKQVIDAADAPGSYSITLTFTGGFEI